jgi:hypothetical protein
VHDIMSDAPRMKKGGRPPSVQDGIPRRRAFGVRLSHEEHASLVANAKKAGLSVSGFVVTALKQVGALEKPKGRRRGRLHG